MREGMDEYIPFAVLLPENRMDRNPFHMCITQDLCQMFVGLIRKRSHSESTVDIPFLINDGGMFGLDTSDT